MFTLISEWNTLADAHIHQWMEYPCKYSHSGPVSWLLQSTHWVPLNTFLKHWRHHAWLLLRARDLHSFLVPPFGNFHPQTLSTLPDSTPYTATLSANWALPTSLSFHVYRESERWPPLPVCHTHKQRRLQAHASSTSKNVLTYSWFK